MTLKKHFKTIVEKQIFGSQSGIFGLDASGSFVFWLIMSASVLLLVAQLFSGAKLSEMQTSISVIRMNVQQMFTSSMDYTGLSNDVTLKAGLIPKKLIKGGAIMNSWGGTLTVAAGDDSGTFSITLTAVPQDGCTKLAVYQREDWLSVEVNDTAVGKDAAIAEAIDACQTSNTIVYTAR